MKQINKEQNGSTDRWQQDGEHSAHSNSYIMELPMPNPTIFDFNVSRSNN